MDTTTIIDTYLKALLAFSVNTQIHFLYRAFLATREETFNQALRTNFEAYALENDEFVGAYIDQYEDTIHKYKEDIEIKLKTELTKIERRACILKLKNPELSLFNLVLHKYFKSSLIHHPIDRQIPLYIREKMKSQLFLNSEYIRYMTISIVNIVEFAKNFDLFNEEDELMHLLMSLYTKEDLSAKELFRRYIYME